MKVMTKRRAALILMLALMLLAAAALASTPTHGRTRIYGYKDEIHKPGNMFAPYAVFTDVPHVEDKYLEFYYNKLGSDERSWQLFVVNEKGFIDNIDGSWIRIYLPFPSIWSAEKQEYWKWTKTYAQKHYDWEWAKGIFVGSLTVENVDTGAYLKVLTYVRGEYDPIDALERFGPCLDINRAEFFNGLALFVRFSGERVKAGKRQTTMRLPDEPNTSGKFYYDISEVEELIVPEGVKVYHKANSPHDPHGGKMQKLKRIIWPESLTDGSSFAEIAPNLKEICYMGSELEWEKTEEWWLFDDVKIIYDYKPEE